MEGVKWKIGLIHLNAVVDHEALPLEIPAKPHSERFLLQHSLGILKETGEDPASSFCKDLQHLHVLGELRLDELDLKIAL